jgi:hypothetical protein
MAVQQVVLLLLLAVPAPSEKGTLRVQAEPGTEVVWEGVWLDKTDARGILIVSDVPPGRFSVTLQKPGSSPETRTVQIEPGQTTVLTAARPAPAAPKANPPSRVVERGAPARAAPAPTRETVREVASAAPAEPAPVPPSSSSGTLIGPPSVGSLLGLLVAVGALLAVIFLLRRRSPVLALPPAPPAETDVLESARGAHAAASAPFLSDLKRREELLEQGVEIIPPRPPDRRVIDLDAANVREVDD